MNQPSNNYNFKVVSFDLDGTLTESKASLSEEMSELLCKLLEKHTVAVVSGGAFPQFKKQILDRLSNASEENLGKLFLFPTNGSALYVYLQKKWQCVYEEKLSYDDRGRIVRAWQEALAKTGIVLPTPAYGAVMEDRGTQITFSACGQEAPISVKSIWDPDEAKRKLLGQAMTPFLPEFAISFGGMTSIDVTKKGIDKAYAIEKMVDYLKVSKDDIMFVGDKLEPGGNDYPARKTGVHCVSVSGPVETADVIRKIIS